MTESDNGRGGARSRVKATLAVAAGLAVLSGCASPGEKDALRRYAQAETSRFEMPDAPAPVLKEPPRIDGNATIDDYVRYAFLNNPGLKAAFRRWRAALDRIPQARFLDDPAFTYEYSLDRRDFLHRFAATQTIPGVGKLGLRAREKLAEAEAAAHEFEAARLTLYGETVTAFHEYDYLRRATGVTEENRRLLADLESVVQAKYKAGSAGFADLVKVQVELDRLNNELATLSDERSARSAELASLLNLPFDGPLPWPVMTPSAQGLIPDEGLTAILRDLNPELKALDAMVRRERAAVRLARRSRYPDFMVGAGLMVMPGMEGGADETEAGLMAGISLPLWQGRYSAEIREAEAMLEAAATDRDNMENALKAELKMALFMTRDAERRMRLFGDSLVPKAEQAYEVARQEFSAGKADFMTLIDAQRTLLEFKLMRERAVADREIALADIGCCIGKYGIPLRE
ncbi:MAG: TolC family protein [Lentisphaerae bacterium]|nr:TolC family protein [Lentisphaerota bacterium]